jgi:hypothetical protein
MTGLDFAALDQPLEPVTLPRGPNGAPGRTFAVQEFTLGMEKLAERVKEQDEAAAQQLLRRCLPGITDAEVDELTSREALLIIAYCGRRLAEVVHALGNAAGAAGPEAAAAAATSPSAPTTNTSTPSPASPARSGRTGGRSRRSRSTASSTASIG